MTLAFKNYGRIEHLGNVDFYNKILMSDAAEAKWIATEKIHGANFSFYVTSDEIKIAKRTSFLADDSKFFDSHILKRRYKKNIRDYFEGMGAEKIILYGELYGPGVQKGINYGNRKDWIAFDVWVEGGIYGDGEYLSHDAMENLAAVQIPTVPIIGEGTLEEVLEISPCFDSRLLNVSDNLAEGLVLKPVEPLYVAVGTWAQHKRRVLLKNKNQKFIETEKRRVAQKRYLSNEAKDFAEDVSRYITANRLQNVISKEGVYGREDIGKFLGFFLQDVWRDYTHETMTELKALKKQHHESWSLINKILSKKAIPLLLQEANSYK